MNPVIIGKATLYNMDCMELLKATPDKFYDLAIVDPPYGGATIVKPNSEQSINELRGGGSRLGEKGEVEIWGHL